eukprot:13206739-Heterocapsa_arctica.AAC.1
MGHRNLGGLPQVQGHAGVSRRCSDPLDRCKAPLEKGLGSSNGFLALSETTWMGNEVSQAGNNRPGP